MNTFLELTEAWAKENGWWTSLTGPVDDGYLYIAKQSPFNTTRYDKLGPALTLWADGAWSTDGDYPETDDQKLNPADPDYFINLKYLVVTKT